MGRLRCLVEKGCGLKKRGTGERCGREVGKREMEELWWFWVVKEYGVGKERGGEEWKRGEERRRKEYYQVDEYLGKNN